MLRRHEKTRLKCRIEELLKYMTGHVSIQFAGEKDDHFIMMDPKEVTLFFSKGNDL